MLIFKDVGAITSGPERRGMANAITSPRLIEKKILEIDYDSGSGCINKCFDTFVSLWHLPYPPILWVILTILLLTM